MQLSRLLSSLSWLLLPVALLGTTWLYLYPLFHGCAFPQPSSTSLPLLSARAPFRLLALGDPQLEGDSSLPDPTAPLFPSLQHVARDLRRAGSELDAHRARVVVRDAARGAVADSAAWLEGRRKALDLWGNDWYLAHIVRSLRWWTEPSHVAVLGDLLGSQWITDGEFERRAGRYWGTVMRGLERVDDQTMGVDGDVESDHYDEPAHERRTWGGTTQVLGADERWGKRVINIAGNHDIGYAGDIDNARVDRFERAFGSVNWDVWFTLPANTANHVAITGNSTTPPPALRLVVLNTMNLDTPAHTDSLQQDTYAFMNHVISTSRPVTDKTHATILLTHIPLHKEPGLCVDSPYFDYFESGHGVREQNMLSEYGSKLVLESIFGLNKDVNAEGHGKGRPGIILNGHDHAGCDTLHWIPQPGAPPCTTNDLEAANAYSPLTNDTETLLPDDDVTANTTISSAHWRAARFPPPAHSVNPDGTCTHIPSSPHLREITLRSMMGDFSGYAGFLSAWFDPQRGERGEWVLEFGSCGVGVQHWWWVVHIVDLVLGVCVVGALVVRGWENMRGKGGETRGKDGEMRGKGGEIGGKGGKEMSRRDE